MERRNHLRCPICHGPAISDSNGQEGIKCRSSICRHNHKHIVCPRCGAKELESVTFQSGHYHYVCADCLNVWKAEQKNSNI